MKVGVTGGIAAGKTAVCGILGGMGSRIIDADRIGRDLLEGRLLEKVVETFGDAFIRPDGLPDRRALGRLVFSRPEKLKTYNSIIHPPLLRELEKELETRPGDSRTAVVDAALLYEWEIHSWFDKILVVTAPDSLRIERLVASAGLTPDEARHRLAGQMDQDEKARRADHVIVNDKTLADLREQVARLWPGLGR